MDRWIIQPNVLGGWDVKAQESARPSFQTSTRKEAEDWAQTAANPGDTVVVLNRTGETLTRFAVPGGDPVPEVSSVSGPVAPAHQQTWAPVQPSGSVQPASPGFLKESEQLSDWISDYLPIPAAFGTAFVSAEVAEAAKGGWEEVFLVTLTWSLGCAMATFFIIRYRLQSWGEIAAAAAGSMIAAYAIATVLGFGVLEFSSDEPLGSGGHPFGRVLIVFTSTAFTTYGSFGALLSAGIGIWLGYRVAQRFPATP